MPRFFVEPHQISDGTVTLTGENAHHISMALRLAVGEHVTVCDGVSVYDCVLSFFDGQTVKADVASVSSIDTEPPYVAHLYQALPKGDKLDTVIQKAVECGVYEIVPFQSSRCIAKAKADGEADKTKRRCRIAAEAAKQSGRGRVPAVKPTVSFEQMLALAEECDLCLFCYEGEGTQTLASILQNEQGLPARPRIAVIVGSEGGFSPEEAARAEAAGMKMTGLGKRILRTETAAPFVLGCLVYRFEM